MTADYEFDDYILNLEAPELAAEITGEEEFGRGGRWPARSFAPRRSPSRRRSRWARRPVQWTVEWPASNANLNAPDSPTGSEYVRWVQTMLNRALSLQLPVDGVMSVQVRSAVRSFQVKNGLAVTGIVGPDTEKALAAASTGQSLGASAARPEASNMAEPSHSAPPPTEPALTVPAIPDLTSPAAEFELNIEETFGNGGHPFLLDSGDTPERFIGAEHRDIGDLASGRSVTTIRYGEQGKHLTFGEVVALAGDHFETYGQLQELEGTAAGRAKIAWARWYALDLKDQKVPEPRADSKAVMEQFYLLANRNWSHFSMGGAWNTYVSWHSQALADAFEAGQSGSERVWRRALTKDAFGIHFLTDMFSAGHVRMPRIAIRDWYAKNIPGDVLLRYMAKYLAARVPLPLVKRFLRFVAPSIAEKRALQQIVNLGGAAARTISVGDIVSMALHDYDNQHLEVVSEVDPSGKRIKGGFPWTAVGDGKLRKGSAGAMTKTMATAAVKASIRDLKRVRAEGRKHAGRRLSSPQKANAIKQALGGKYAPTFAARAFVPQENRASSANVPLPGATSAKSPLEWRWGQLGDITYHCVDETIKKDIAVRLEQRLKDVPDAGTRDALSKFVEHLKKDGIRAIEMAVGRKAR